jgi:hypothetical protein
MSDRTMSSAKTLIVSVFLLGLALAYEACSNSRPEAGLVINASIANGYDVPSGDRDALRQMSCPLPHRTVLVRLFGESLCPVQIPKPIATRP